MPETGENFSDRFLQLQIDDYCSAQDRPRELKLVTLKPPGNEDSEYVFTNVLTCL